MDTENRLIVVKGKGAGDWVRRVKELSKEKQKKKFMEADNCMVSARRKGG